MFDYQLNVSVSDQAWNATSAQAVLAESDEAFFAESGAVPSTEDTRRRYRRVRARGRAIAIIGNDRYGVLTTDVSPMGIGFLSPVQFLPKKVITLYFQESDPVTLEIRRCVRTDAGSYSCGGNFLSGPLSPSDYREFLADLRN